MIFRNWVLSNICGVNGFKSDTRNKKIYISVMPDQFASMQVVSERKECTENSIYKFNIDLDLENVEYKIIMNWFDGEGKSILRNYVKTNDETLCPVGAKNAEIKVIIYSRLKGMAVLGHAGLEYLRPYEPKNVTLAAVTLGEEAFRDTAKLTSNFLINEHLKKIDAVMKLRKPDMIVLGEHFHNSYVPNLTSLEKSITLDGPIMREMRAKAKEHKTFLAFSIHRKDEKDNIYATAVLIDRKGEVAGIYDKTHLTTREFEMGLVPGMRIPVFETEIGRIGFLICWDIWFPGISQILYKKGAQIILNPSAGRCFYQTAATAYLTGAPIVVAKDSSEELTRIVDGSGDMLDDAIGKGYAVATIDINKPIMTERLSVGSCGIGRNIYVNEARPDLYGELTKKGEL